MPARAALGLPDVRGRTPLLAGLAIDSFCGGCVGPLLLIYFNRVAGIPLGRAGTILTLASIVSLAVPAVVGHVIDRFGARNLVVFSQLAQGWRDSPCWQRDHSVWSGGPFDTSEHTREAVPYVNSR